MSERPPRPSVEVTDPRVLRALTHPLRTRILGVLRLDGPSTATLLAQRLAESSGATSYHLRELHRFGFVEDAPGRGTGRERWWQAAHRSTRWQSDDFADPPLADELAQRLVRLHQRLLDAYLEQRPTLPAAWAGLASFSDLPMHLNRAQLTRLNEELGAVLERWRDEEAGEPAAPGTTVVQVLTQVFPLPDYPTIGF